jgi:hypothetical protein
MLAIFIKDSLSLQKRRTSGSNGRQDSIGSSQEPIAGGQDPIDEQPGSYFQRSELYWQ